MTARAPSGDLRGRVAPALVELVVQRNRAEEAGSAASSVTVPGVTVTASGLVLTSLKAVEAAVGHGAGALTILRPRTHEREARGAGGARSAGGDPIPGRVVAVSPEMDLALVESLPAAATFFAHLPVVRHQLPAPGPEAPAPVSWASAARPAPGVAVVDEVGRIAGLVVTPANGDGLAIVDGPTLVRFLFAAGAPELRFAGVAPRQRPSIASARASVRAVTRAATDKREASRPAAPAAARGSAHPQVMEIELPSVVKKHSLDSRFLASSSGSALRSSSTRSDARPSAETPAPGRRGSGAPAPGTPAAASDDLAVIALADLQRQSVPTSTSLATADARDRDVRGARGAPVTIVELGGYHAPTTRDVEDTLRALTEGPGATARLLWKDADRGSDAEYQLAARAARAAGEQGQFWPMHDRLLRLPRMPSADRLTAVARALDLDASAFASSLGSDGLASDVDREAREAGRLPVLCTPAFVVEGVVVDGGSVAPLALRAAVEAELQRRKGAPATGEHPLSPAEAASGLDF